MATAGDLKILLIHKSGTIRTVENASNGSTTIPANCIVLSATIRGIPCSIIMKSTADRNNGLSIIEEFLVSTGKGYTNTLEFYQKERILNANQFIMKFLFDPVGVVQPVL